MEDTIILQSSDDETDLDDNGSEQSNDEGGDTECGDSDLQV